MQIAGGLEYFKTLAATARPKVVALRDAVVAGDVEAAKAAYINSRNEYEQIEVLAPGFGDVDCSIDCRASAPLYSMLTPDNFTYTQSHVDRISAGAVLRTACALRTREDPAQAP